MYTRILQTNTAFIFIKFTLPFLFFLQRIFDPDGEGWRIIVLTCLFLAPIMANGKELLMTDFGKKSFLEKKNILLDILSKLYGTSPMITDL